MRSSVAVQRNRKRLRRRPPIALSCPAGACEGVNISLQEICGCHLFFFSQSPIIIFFTRPLPPPSSGQKRLRDDSNESQACCKLSRCLNNFSEVSEPHSLKFEFCERVAGASDSDSDGGDDGGSGDSEGKAAVVASGNFDDAKNLLACQEAVEFTALMLPPPSYASRKVPGSKRSSRRSSTRSTNNSTAPPRKVIVGDIAIHENLIPSSRELSKTAVSWDALEPHVIVSHLEPIIEEEDS